MHNVSKLMSDYSPVTLNEYSVTFSLQIDNISIPSLIHFLLNSVIDYLTYKYNNAILALFFLGQNKLYSWLVRLLGYVTIGSTTSK